MTGPGNGVGLLSFHDYEVSRFLASGEVPFYGVVMAAMRLADSDNVEKLKSCFPETWTELGARYHARGGVLPDDPFFLCRDCGTISHHPEDKMNQYCGACHTFTGDIRDVES